MPSTVITQTIRDIPALTEVHDLYRRLTLTLIQQGRSITVMESCTGGLIASLITDTEGSSAILRGAFVTYSNQAKIDRGVPAEIINTYGVYSAETARAMALACQRAFDSDYAIGLTGSLGNPDPANPDSVPGEAYFTIRENGTERTVFLRLCPAPSRFDAKLQIAAAVAREILQRA